MVLMKGRRKLSSVRLFISGFWKMIIAVVFLCSLNLAIFYVIREIPSLVDYLWLSSSNLLGFITASFVHFEFSPHLAGNLIIFIAESFVFILCCQAGTRKMRSRWGKRFIVMGLGAGFSATFIAFLFYE